MLNVHMYRGSNHFIISILKCLQSPKWMYFSHQKQHPSHLLLPMMLIVIELQLGYLVSLESKFICWHAVIELKVIVKTVVQAINLITYVCCRCWYV